MGDADLDGGEQQDGREDPGATSTADQGTVTDGSDAAGASDSNDIASTTGTSSDAGATPARGAGTSVAAGTTVDILNPWDTRVAFDGDPIDFNPPNNGYQDTQRLPASPRTSANPGLNLPSGDLRVLYLPA